MPRVIRRLSMLMVTCTVGVLGASWMSAQEDFRPWVRNSIQPAPEFKPAPLPTTTPQPGDGETETICRAAIAWFTEAAKRVDGMVPAAEDAAGRLVAGGELYIDGTSGFAQEMFGRAGGFAFTKVWQGERIEANDVLLVGLMRPREADGPHALPTLAWGGRNFRGLVVHFAGHRWPGVARTLPNIRMDRWKDRLKLIDTGAPDGATWADVCVNQMSAVATTWVFQGEMFAAGTRQGKTLATLASYVEPEGERWDRAVQGKKLHPVFHVPAVPAGKIGTEYLLTAQKQVAEFLTSGEAKQVRLAAERLARAMKRGNRVFVIVSGHVHCGGAIVPRDVADRLIVYGRPWHLKSGLLKKGDVLLDLGYLEYPKKRVVEALAAGGEVVTIAVADGPTDESRTHIRGHWTEWDSVINVTGYPVRILPSSGVVQTVQWYALMAETEKVFNRGR
ncbi:MAG TPA: hypothetical protein VMY39_00065 [Planctomycetota bacterium]|nr:hypothetical protein [Planctomycetota bacterium]